MAIANEISTETPLSREALRQDETAAHSLHTEAYIAPVENKSFSLKKISADINAQESRFDFSRLNAAELYGKSKSSGAESKGGSDNTPAANTAPKSAKPEEQMLDPNVSAEQKIVIAERMYKAGLRSFAGPDGHRYQINEAKIGDRKMVSLSTDDGGQSKIVLRGIVEKDGHASKQKDSKGRSVEYESEWARAHEGGGIRNPEAVTRGIDTKDGSTYERRSDKQGGFEEKHTGEKPEQNYLRTGDGKGNNVESRDDGHGNRSEKHTFEDPKKNYTREAHADGTYTVTDSVGLKVDVVGGSPEFQRRMLADIENLPEADRKRLAERDVHYRLGSKMSEIDPSLAGVHPRGWPPGKTWDDAEGCYEPGKREIRIAESTTSGSSARLPGVLRHETGHAVDGTVCSCTNCTASGAGDSSPLSHSDDFKRAYEADVTRMTPEQRQEFSYLLQHDRNSQGVEQSSTNSGQEETAAEVYGMLQGSSANPGQTDRIRQIFPAVADLLSRRLAASA